jgi:hypothetical protein
MMEEVSLGIYIMSLKPIFSEAMNKADVVSMNILDALDFLLRPLRQKPL